MTHLQLARAALATARDPEAVIAGPMSHLRGALGDPQAHKVPGALQDGQSQFSVSGAFLVTPDERHMMLVGNTGFPPEQRRLCIPIDGGDPGRVIASGAPLLISDTHSHGGFRQYLKTARMGSACYAPLMDGTRCFGLIIVAALAANTMAQRDLDLLIALAPDISAAWRRLGGPDWLQREFARATASGDAFFAARGGVE